MTKTARKSFHVEISFPQNKWRVKSLSFNINFSLGDTSIKVIHVEWWQCSSFCEVLHFDGDCDRAGWEPWLRVCLACGCRCPRWGPSAGAVGAVGLLPGAGVGTAWPSPCFAARGISKDSRLRSRTVLSGIRRMSLWVCGCATGQRHSRPAHKCALQNTWPVGKNQPLPLGRVTSLVKVILLNVSCVTFFFLCYFKYTDHN